MGLEIKIPKEISSYALPCSFRFYESIISVVRDMIDLRRLEDQGKPSADGKDDEENVKIDSRRPIDAFDELN